MRSRMHDAMHESACAKPTRQTRRSKGTLETFTLRTWRRIGSESRATHRFEGTGAGQPLRREARPSDQHRGEAACVACAGHPCL
eukprot:6172104-Pleurochrysis_carterae.AAC.1